jgi:hypothetical protein
MEGKIHWLVVIIYIVSYIWLPLRNIQLFPYDHDPRNV